MNQSDLHGRLARWALKLQGFRFSIRHRKGSQNIVPDALSRIYCPETSEISEIHEANILFDIDLTSPFFKSDSYCELIAKLSKNKHLLPDIKIVDGFIYKRVDFATGHDLQEESSWKVWIPAEMRLDLIMRAHDPPLSSHGGIGKTLSRLRTFCFWPGMCKQVKSYIGNCDICKQTKATNRITRPLMGNQVESIRIFQRLYIDLIGPFPRSAKGNIGLLIILDHLSKFCIIEPIRKFTTNIIVEILEKRVFHIFGTPETVTTDNGVQFKANLFKNFLINYGVHHNFTAIYSPQGNASERVNRSIIAAIRAYVNPSQRDWDLNISSIGCALRSVKHVAIGYSPYFMVFGQNMLTNGKMYSLLRNIDMLEEPLAYVKNDDKLELIRSEAREQIRRSYETNANRYNLRSRDIRYEPGDIVFYKNFKQSKASEHYNVKLDNKFIKATVMAKIGNVYYDLKDMSGKPVGRFHAKDLRK